MSRGAPLFAAEQRRTLLSIARSSVEASVLGTSPAIETPSDPVLRELWAAFVTLTCRGELRGCIGFSEAVRPLDEVVRYCAVAAATEDRRFRPVEPEELTEIRLSISVLSPMRAVSGPDLIEVGRHGLLVRNGERRGLLLPQVAAERGWDAPTFLRETSRKAGLPEEAWRSPESTVFVFEAEVFSEPEF